ncbi:hypothetical protein QFC22_003451 [Naganishia vaughanmartiniae]|uniref:Uncharacterized protein n=1 Tax=Naganishia vaughanmartiniae TaxID=1424756 RepID=A0ACC2X9J9_9TREE|nr:hypothetical protein QFC22_003451 [Naganishia vaughanmartiniae]
MVTGHAHRQSSTVDSENGHTTGLNKKELSTSSPSDLEALSISMPPSLGGNGSTPTLNNGERDEFPATDAKEDQEEDVGLAHTQTSTPQLFLQPLSRRKSSIPHPPASPTFPPMLNGQAHQTPTWHPRSSLAEQGHSSGTISPASRSTTPALAAAAAHQQSHHLHYEYQESPRSPLAWRQTFGEAVRLNTGGGRAVSPALPHTPTPAPAPEGRSSRSSRQGSVNTRPAEGYFAFTGGGLSREGSLVGMGDDEAGPVLSPGKVANRMDHASTPVGCEGTDRVVVAFGPVPTRDVASSGGAADISGAVSPGRHGRAADPGRVWKEESKLHGLGFDTRLSRLASPSPFESVSLNSSESERSDHEQEQHDGQGQLSPLPPSSARSRSFNTRSSLGSLNAAEHEPTTPRQRQPSSRRVSAASLSTTTSPQRGIMKSPGPPRWVSAGGGLWGTIETENTTRETSMSPRRRENGTRSPLHGSVEGANDDDARSMTGTMKSVPLSRDASTSSRRASAASVVPAASNGASPTVVTTPRLQAPPAVPHDLDPALLVKLSKAGASSMALWAAKGDPAAATAARIAGDGSKKKRLSMRTSGDSVRASMASERTAVSMPGTPPMSSDTGGGGGANQRVSGPTYPAFGPSKLDQVRSQTRMVHLPPKSKEEDAVHLERWKEMMEQSRLAGKLGAV